MSSKNRKPTKRVRSSKENADVHPNANGASWWKSSLDAKLDGIAVCLLLAVVFMMGCTREFQSDTGWHLKTGELICERMEWPEADWFTYPSGNERWIDLHWGFQVSAYNLFRLGGMSTLVIAKCLLAVTTFVVIVMAFRTGLRGRLLWLLPSVFLFAERYVVRPEAITLLLVAVTFIVWKQATKSPYLLWFLIPVQMLWVNCHALFVIGLLISGCLLLEILASRWCKLPKMLQSDSHPPAKVALAAFVGSVMACFMNPYGVSGFLFPLELFTRIGSGATKEFFQQLCGEFRGMNELTDSGWWSVFTGAQPIFLIAQYVAILASFVVLFSSRSRLPFGRLLMTLGFAYLSWQSWRNGALLAVVGSVVISQNVTESAWPHSGTNKRSRMWRLATVVILAAICISIPTNIYAHLRDSRAPRTFGVGEKPFVYAHEAAQFLGQEGMPMQVYACHFGHAATCIWHNGSTRKVFADGRLELNKRQVLEDYLDVQTLLIQEDPRAEELLSSYAPAGELPALLLDVEYFAPFPKILYHPRWVPVYSDGVAIVFLDKATADSLGTPAVDRALLSRYLTLVQQAGSVSRLHTLRSQVQSQD